MKPSTFLRIAAITALACLQIAHSSTLASAQKKKEFTQEQLFHGYLNSPGYKVYLTKIFNLTEHPALKKTCKTLKVIDAKQYQVLKKPHFIKQGKGVTIDKGSWLARAKVDRCGQTTYRRAVLEAQPGKNQLKPVPLLPGDFRGNLKLEFDARRIVYPAIGAKAKCAEKSKIFVLDVKAGNKGSAKGWWETWTALTCNKTIKAAVKYFATGNGMQIVTKVGKEGETPSWAEK